MHKDSIKNVVIIALSLCLVCAVMVSVPAVAWRDLQGENVTLDMQRNVLMALGLKKDDVKKMSRDDVAKAFEAIDTVAVQIDEARILNKDELPKGFEPEKFDLAKVAKDESLSIAIPGSHDDNGMVQRRPTVGVIYVTRTKDNKIDKIVLPIRGMGLWGMMHGFIALESDLRSVAGLKYYDHKETPGLGAEVDNEAWRSQWANKSLSAAGSTEVTLRVIKGSADSTAAGYEQKIDGISGATITCNGVNSTLAYWLGDNGYGPLLKKLRDGEVTL